MGLAKKLDRHRRSQVNPLLAYVKIANNLSENGIYQEQSSRICERFEAPQRFGLRPLLIAVSNCSVRRPEPCLFTDFIHGDWCAWVPGT